MVAQISQSRMTNLRWLIRQEGSVSRLATKLAISPIYIFNVLDGQFSVGDSLARKIEGTFGYPLGWMDGSGDINLDSEAVVPILSLDQKRLPGIVESSDDSSEDNAELEEDSSFVDNSPELIVDEEQESVDQCLELEPNFDDLDELIAGNVDNLLPADDVSHMDDEESSKDQNDSSELVSDLLNVLEGVAIESGLNLSPEEKSKLLVEAGKKVLEKQQK